jgi:kynurenine formamidase
MDAKTPASPLPRFRAVDLTHPLDAAGCAWPGEPPFRLEAPEEAHLPDGTRVVSHRFSCPEHTGTHVDAPAHVAAAGLTVDALPLSRLIGEGACVDARGAIGGAPRARVTRAVFEEWEARHGALARGSIVLVATGWSVRWGDPLRYLGSADRTADGAAALAFPGLDGAAARWLAEERSVGAVGIDTAGIDPGDSSDLAAHRALLPRGVVVFENLARLDALPPRGFLVVALPLPIRGGTGAPARIVALLPDPQAGPSFPS